ncbi:hypothetical protein BDB01DRAFT_852806 [Pilobolus umbonatus]|nr:hypothetical protein BDB01DRAFT_852806 [Pilobolus umbonatus]
MKSSYDRLERLVDKWLDLSCERMNLKHLLSTLNRLLPSHEEEINNALQQGKCYFQSQLRILIMQEFQDRRLHEAMDELDQCIKEAEGRPRIDTRILPTPKQVIRGLVCHEKEEEYHRLKTEYESLQRQNHQWIVQMEEKKQAREEKAYRFHQAILKITQQPVQMDELLDQMHQMKLPQK